MVLVTLNFQGPTLHRAHDNAASSWTFTANAGVPSTFPVIGILRHLWIGLTLDIALRWTTTRQGSRSRRARAENLEEFRPGDPACH